MQTYIEFDDTNLNRWRFVKDEHVPLNVGARVWLTRNKSVHMTVRFVEFNPFTDVLTAHTGDEKIDIDENIAMWLLLNGWQNIM